jgi:hypothetical protein
VSEQQSFIVRSKMIRGNAVVAVQNIGAEPIMQVTIKPYRKSKTDEQRGYLFGVVFKKIREKIEDSGGGHYTGEDIYAWMIDEYGEERLVQIDGKTKVTRLTVSNMNTKEMSTFIDRVIIHAATSEQLDHLAIPPPEYR